MNVYANAFRCATKDDGSEFIIEFIQESPMYDEENSVIGTNREVVSSIVTSFAGAKSLAELILEHESRLSVNAKDSDA